GAVAREAVREVVTVGLHGAGAAGDVGGAVEHEALGVEQRHAGEAVEAVVAQREVVSGGAPGADVGIARAVVSPGGRELAADVGDRHTRLGGGPGVVAKLGRGRPIDKNRARYCAQFKADTSSPRID